MHDLPREKILKYGIKSLSYDEVLAVLIGSGTKDENVFMLSKRIIDELISLDNIQNLDIHDLMNFKGVGLSKASIILAALELNKRLERRKKNRLEINNSKDIFLASYSSFLGLKNERLEVIFLDSSSKVISKIDYDGFNYLHVDIDINEILRKSLILKAQGIALIHNHPSGLLEPSDEDLYFTDRLIQKLSTFSLRLIDHLIIYDHSFYSILYGEKYQKKKPKKRQN